MNRFIASAGLGLLLWLPRPGAALDTGYKPELTVYVSGASAQDNALELLFRNLCVITPQDDAVNPAADNTLHIYRQGNNQRALVCRVSAEKSGLSKDTVVAFFKSSVGGSGNGPIPVANGDGKLADGSPARFIDLGKVDRAGVCEPAPVLKDKGAAAPFREYFERLCSEDVLTEDGIVPDAGIADVEPRLLGADEAQRGVLRVTSQNAVIFGVPVTRSLRDALQVAQGLKPGVEDEANMPSLTRAQLASLYAGTLKSWDQLIGKGGKSLVELARIGAPKDTRVFLCRRVATSGTEAAFEVFFLGQRCGVHSATMQTANDGGKVGAGTVNEGSGTGDVKDCLNQHEFARHWAIGMFSTENTSNLEYNDTEPPPGAPVGKRDDRWRFIRIDGYTPSLRNVAEGRYDFFMEQTIMYRERPGLRGSSELGGDKKTLIDTIARNAGNPQIIRALNRRFRHPWGDSGLMALTTHGYAAPPVPRTDASVAQMPVLTSTRSPDGITNNCILPALVVAPQDITIGP